MSQHAATARQAKLGGGDGAAATLSTTCHAMYKIVCDIPHRHYQCLRGLNKYCARKRYTTLRMAAATSSIMITWKSRL